MINYENFTNFKHERMAYHNHSMFHFQAQSKDLRVAEDFFWQKTGLNLHAECDDGEVNARVAGVQIELCIDSTNGRCISFITKPIYTEENRCTDIEHIDSRDILRVSGLDVINFMRACRADDELVNKCKNAYGFPVTREDELKATIYEISRWMSQHEDCDQAYAYFALSTARDCVEKELNSLLSDKGGIDVSNFDQFMNPPIAE